MRILQIAPLLERVPPPAYGGTEVIVSALADGLVDAGHEVILWASGDSITKAQLRSVYGQSIRSDPDIIDRQPYELAHFAAALSCANDFDIVHNHAGEAVMAFADLVKTPMLTTMHCLINADTRIIWDHYRGYYNTISRAQESAVPHLPNARSLGYVHNAIDVASFPFRDRKDDYLLFLSRISADKGAHLAIEIARKAGRRLVMAGKVDRADRHYFETAVEPLLGQGVEFVGEADFELKRDLYSRAAGVILPLLWEEPFGLVFIEAMACGTPVISYNRGAAPEIIVDGVTGFLVEDAAGMLSAIDRLPAIDPQECRRHVENNFDNPVMVGRYLELYERICGVRSGLLTLSR